MAKAILTPQENSRYQLSALDRQAILSQALFPKGKIHPAAYQQIAKQRANFVHTHGSDGVELTYCLPETDRQKILQWAKKERELGEKSVKFNDI
jgi:hypothetical protein